MRPATATGEVGAGSDRLTAALAHAGDDPFAGVIAATRTAVAITDPRLPDNPVIFVNDSFCALTGYTRDEVVGRNCRFLQGPATNPVPLAAIRTALAAGDPVEVDLLNYRKDGSSFWNRLAIAPVFDAGGNVTYFFASQSDVSDERAREAALVNDNATLTVEVAERLTAQQDSEARLRFAAEAAGVAIWEIALPTLELTGTANLAAVYGLAPGTVPTVAAIRAATHPEDAAESVDAFDLGIANTGRKTYFNTYRIMRHDGSIGWIEARGQLINDDAGRAVRLIGVSLDVTARREAEARIELSEASLRLATEAAGVGTWDFDLTTETLTWSDRTKAMFGISPNTSCSMADFYGGLHPDDVAATTAAFAAALDPARRAAYDVEYRTVGKEDGVVRWVAAKGTGLFTGDRCVRAVGSVLDITRQRRLEEHQRFLFDLADALRRLDDPQAAKRTATVRLGAFLGVNRVGYAEVSDDSTTAVIESAWLRDAAPFDGEFVLDSFGPALIDQMRAGRTVADGDVAVSSAGASAAWRAIATRAHVSVPVLRDGRLRGTMFVLNAAPTEWDADDVALIEDVAARTWEAVERARAETERQASEARLRAVIEAAPIGLVFASAPDGAIIGGNHQVEQLLRHPVLPSPDVEHYSEWVSFHPDGRQVEGHEYPLAKALDGEERPELEVLYRRGDGTDAWLRFIAAPVRGPDGTISGGVVATLDIDPERRAEVALRDLNATLERRVEERTAELYAAEEALRQAQKMEAVGQLTGGIAHDFNNMLGIVLGSLDLLGRRLGDDPRARRYVDAATDGARRAATLTQRLLAFSRRQPLQPEPVDVNRLVAGMSDLLRGSLGGGIQLETVLAGGLWPICVDPNQLENVILNLAINARDAMGGDGRVTIETHNCHLDDSYVAAEIGVASGQYVLIAVTDAGTGMPADVIAKAFDPFFTTKGVGQGTGLGLSQVYGFVKQSGGHVKIYSEVGVGTTVKLYLPRLSGEQPPAPDAVVAREPAGGDASELILVVEDEAGVRAVSVEALRELGYDVIEADGAAAALPLIAAHPELALLFTDIVMPGMNGAKLAEAARAVRPDLKVLFTTGYTRNAVVHNGVVDAGVELIGKPFTVDALALKVRRVLDGN